jgi:MalT-like TPR region
VQALRLAANQDGTVLRGTADMHVGMSQIACERDDLPAATRHLLRAEELGEHTWLPQNPYRWRVAMARVREAEGDLDGALDLLDEAQRVYMGDFSPNVRPIPALRARVLAAQGRLGEALAWAASKACRLRMICPTYASSSTSAWPGCCWPSTGRGARRLPFPMRPGSCSAFSRLPRRG